MSGNAPSSGADAKITPLLEAIRRKEAEVKRLLTAENEAARAALAAAESQARGVIAAAAADGERAGNDQRQAAQEQADAEAQAIVAQARAEAEELQRVGAQRMETAIQLAVATVCEVRR
jgi:vacuolar-type H+-ATPase subunit H